MAPFITSFIVALFLIVFYKFCEKVFPVGKAEYSTNKNFAALKILYVGHDFKQQGIFLGTAVAAGLILVKLLEWLLDLRLSFVSDQEIIVKPGADMRYVLSIFAGLLIAVPVSFWIGKRQLKGDWPEFLAYTNLKYKFNAMKVMKYVTGFISVLVGLLTIIYFDYYSTFGKQEIKINGALSLGSKTYKYSDITKIKALERFYAPNGNIVTDPHFVIEFNDGKKWNSRESGFERNDENRQIIELVQSKTDLELIKQEFDN